MEKALSKRVINIVKIVLLILIVIIDVLFLLNNGIDQKYLVEPFDLGDEILDLKEIAIQKI